MSEIDDLENLLNEAQKEYDKIKYNQYNNIENGAFDSKLLKADKSASLYDFITMIDKIVTKTLSEYNVEFIPDEGKIVYLSNDEKLDHPIITYKLKERKPKGELKPRIREHFMEDKGDSNSRIGEIYGQRFKCHLQFNIFASEYKTCNEIMDKFGYTQDENYDDIGDGDGPDIAPQIYEWAKTVVEDAEYWLRYNSSNTSINGGEDW